MLINYFKLKNLTDNLVHHIFFLVYLSSIFYTFYDHTGSRGSPGFEKIEKLKTSFLTHQKMSTLKTWCDYPWSWGYDSV